MFCGTYEQAIRTARSNAAASGTPRYVFAYINDWHCEKEPVGDNCIRVMPDSSQVQMRRNDSGTWGDQPVANPRSMTCPHCGSKLIVGPVAQWQSQSLEPCDTENTAILNEYQCTNEAAKCCRSFWLGAEGDESNA